MGGSINIFSSLTTCDEVSGAMIIGLGASTPGVGVVVVAVALAEFSSSSTSSKLMVSFLEIEFLI